MPAPNRVPCTCETCGKSYMIEPNQLHRAEHHFCSDACRYALYRIDPVERFWKYCGSEAGPNACWIWKGTRITQGYGVLKVKGKMVRAHRFSYELHYGPIPDGLDVLHSCDTPACCNPAHLRAGTDAENRQDALDRGRVPLGDEHWTHQHPERLFHPKGELSGTAKLTTEQVQCIRHAYEDDHISQSTIAASFGICQQVVSLIVNRKRWGHIP